ncbi:MAG: SpoIIE family protein phosphatase [Planctomycetaceae bacterium]
MTLTTPSPAVRRCIDSIVQLLQDTDIESPFQSVLAQVLGLLRSPIGFCGYIDAAGSLVLAAASPGVHTSGQSPPRFPQERWGGLWGQVLTGRQPLLRNGSHHVPVGHLAIERSLSVPLLDHANLIGSLLVANRDFDYGEDDLQTLHCVGQAIAPTLRQRIARDAGIGATRSIHLAPSTTTAVDPLEVRLKQLEDILDTTPAVVYVKDLEGRYEFINRRYEERFHVDRRSVIGLTDHDIWPRHLADGFRENDRRVAEAGEPLHLEEIAQHDDGPHTYFSVKFPLHDDQGKVRAVGGVSTDITEDRRNRHQLDSLAMRLNLILNSVGDGVFGIDRHGRLEFMNSTACQLLGYSQQELLGRPVLASIFDKPSDDEQHLLIECPVWTSLREGETFAEDFARFRTREGAAVPVEYVSTPIVQDGEVTGAVIAFRDISAQLEVQSRIETQRQLELRQQANEAQLRAVRELQLTMFSASSPVVPGFAIASRGDASDIVSGDFHDFIRLDDGTLMIIVADASGHDLPAAVHMVETHAALHALMDCDIPVNELLPRLNRTLSRHLVGRFVSMFLVRLDPGTGAIQFAGAGHDALLMRADGTVERLCSTGLVLGLCDDAEFAPLSTRTLEPGDTLLLATDGLHETTNRLNELFGRGRIEELLHRGRTQTVEETLVTLFDECQRFGAGVPADDRTAVLIRRLAPAS